MLFSLILPHPRSGYERPGRAELVCGGVRVSNRDFNLTCMLFVKEPTLEDAIWNGQPVTLQELRATYQVWARGVNHVGAAAARLPPFLLRTARRANAPSYTPRSTRFTGKATLRRTSARSSAA